MIKNAFGKCSVKKIISASAMSLLYAFSVSAAGSWAVMESGETFIIQGDCSSSLVKIDLFGKAEGKNPLYSGEVGCGEGKFYFSSDSFKEDIKAGNYIISVDGEKSWNTVSIKSEDVGSDKKKEISRKQEKKENPDIKFLSAFAIFQQSILDMRTWLAETKYPSWVKTGIDGTLDGIDKLAGKISCMLFSADTPQNETASELTTVTQDSDIEATGGENLENNNDENQSSNSEVINN